jgi:uncharacterized protein (TIGR02265 family)
MADPSFVAPDFEAPIDVDEYLRLIPLGATIKGMFFSRLLDRLGSSRVQFGRSRPRYVAFKDYPLADQVKLIAEVAVAIYPELGLREGMRRVGHDVYPAFASTLVGRVLFAAVGKDVFSMLQAGTKAYSMSASVGTVEILDSAERSALLLFRDIYNFIDSYQVGILEGAFSVLGLTPIIRMKLDGLTSGLFEVTW